jgi:two-component system NarL family response regulator
MLHVVIVDDHRLMQEGLEALLSAAADIEVVGSATDGLEAIATVQRLEPDVVVMDLAMPEINGLEATEILRERGFKQPIVILSMYQNPDFVNLALAKGASAYVLKGDSVEELVEAVRAVAQGEVYLGSALRTGAG